MALIKDDAFNLAEDLKYVSDTGVVVPDVETVRSEVESYFTSADMFGGDFDTTPESLGGRLIEGATKVFVETLGLCALHSNQLNFEYSLGKFLDAHGSMFGLTRNGKTATVVTCRMTGQEGTVVPKGVVAEDEDGMGYILTSSVTLNESGIGDGVFECEELGAVEIKANSIIGFRGDVSDVDTIENLSDGVTGREIESDDEFRVRIRLARSSGSGFIKSIWSRIMSIPSVKSCLVFENGAHTPVWVLASGSVLTTYDSTKQCVPLLPHSICVVVDAPTGDAYNEQIAEAIYKTKSCGSAMTPAKTIATDSEYNYYSGTCKIPIVSNQEAFNEVVTRVNHLDVETSAYYKITFNRPEKKYVKCAITVLKGSYTGTNAELTAEIKSAVNAYQSCDVGNVTGLSIGTNVLAFEIAAAISERIPLITVRNVVFTQTKVGESGSWTNVGGTTGDSATEIQIKILQIGSFNTNSDVTVTINS